MSPYMQGLWRGATGRRYVHCCLLAARVLKPAAFFERRVLAASGSRLKPGSGVGGGRERHFQALSKLNLLFQKHFQSSTSSHFHKLDLLHRIVRWYNTMALCTSPVPIHTHTIVSWCALTSVAGRHFLTPCRISLTLCELTTSNVVFFPARRDGTAGTLALKATTTTTG